ncbi:heavy-metal-associated domain-containing protein [Sunxiuqinia sp. sy24]|uniref:heavy-metal-associated domain-containing protein n=1 Tax=Sunxiuqinia sp. sy24 TaxID=3461495 RepID=UPI004045AC23
MKTSILLLLLFNLATVTCTQKNTQPKTEQVAAKTELVYHVEGMTCDHCEMSIQKGVKELEGIASVEANHEDSTTRVVFDPAKTNKDEIVKAIEKRGYSVVE